MRGSDFRHWFNWVKANVPDPPNYDTAYNIYHDHFSCTCISCTYREEHGFRPIPTGKSDCYCPAGLPVLKQRVA